MTQLIVISAPSGAGKTTLCERLLRDFPSLKLSISTTTRPPRGREINGREYFFVSKEKFEEEIRNNRFAEWALVHGNYYGTSKQFVEDCFRDGYGVLLDIDVQGSASLRNAYPKECYTVFISPPSIEELERRLRNRKTDNEETIQKRIRNAQTEMARKSEFHRIIVNDSLEQAYAELKNAVDERLRSMGE